MYGLGRPTSNDEGVRIEWSEDNLREVELGPAGVIAKREWIERIASDDAG